MPSIRAYYGWLLLSLSACSSPPDSRSDSSAPAARPTSRSTPSAIEAIGVLGPDPDHQPVRPENIVRRDSTYAATLPVLEEPDGFIRLRVRVNPFAHTLSETSLLFAPHLPTVTYRQIGNGVGNYQATTGRYYFNVAFQKVRKLDNGLIDYGLLQEISGWVHPSSSTAAVALKQAP